MAAGLPASAADGVVTGFRDCFVDRAQLDDPGEVPESCRPQVGAPALPPADDALASAAPLALRHSFSDTFAETLLPFVGLFLLVALVVGLVPREPAVPPAVIDLDATGVPQHAPTPQEPGVRTDTGQA